MEDNGMGTYPSKVHRTVQEAMDSQLNVESSTDTMSAGTAD
jgi:hypothetical protein